MGAERYAANFFRWYAEEAVRINGRFTVNEAGTGRVLTLEQPVGPCLFITPWNFPLAMGTRKIGPAIAAGCTMVVKPAKQTRCGGVGPREREVARSGSACPRGR
jgi:succinate-semialdehyde dehydrogenase/glutarate-semialdehyde dehydrogenase